MTETEETLHFLDYWHIVWSRKEIVITFTLLVVLAGVVVTFYTPKTYMASSLIQVKRESSDVDIFRREPATYDPFFLRTQFEIIRSATVVEEVVSRLELDKKLSKAYGYDMLPPEKIFDQTVAEIKDKMKARQYRDTNLIEVQIRIRELGGEEEEAPQIAADVANTIGEVYRDQNIHRKQAGIKRALEALSQEISEQDKKVLEAQAAVDKVRQENEITVLYPQAGTSTDVKKLGLKALEERAVLVRLDLEAQKARYEKAVSLPSDELLAAAPYLQPDPTLSQLVQSRRQAEVTLNDRLQAKLGPNHPDVIQAKAVLRGLDEKIEEALAGLKTGMLADLEAAKARYEWVMQELKSRREMDRIQESSGYREFNRAVSELNRVRDIRDSLEERYIKERIEMEIPKSPVEIMEYAKPPDPESPVSPDFMLNIVLSIMIGLTMGVGLAYFAEYLDTSVKTIEDVERYLGVPVVGVIPQKVKPFNDPSADMKHAEAYRMLKTNIQFSRKMPEGKAICLTSGGMGEGKSLTLFNLAHVAAELGEHVLVIDSDLHRPRQHRLAKIPNKIGLANVLAGEAMLEDVIVATEIPNLDMIPSGKMASGAHGLLDNLRFHEILEALSPHYDMMLFDAPPVIGVSDTSMLIREMDGVVLVIQHRKYPKSVPKRAKSVIENMGANLVGVIINNINISRDYAAYQYHSYTYG